MRTLGRRLGRRAGNPSSGALWQKASRLPPSGSKRPPSPPMPSPLPSRAKSEEPLEASLADLPARDKLEALLELAHTRKRALILTHDNPDPDSLAAAVGLTFLLEKKGGLQAHAAYGGIIGRSENLALVKVLHLPVVPVSQVVFDEYDLLGLVDTQPPTGNHSVPPRYPVDIVVDHHPLRDESLRALLWHQDGQPGPRTANHPARRGGLPLAFPSGGQAPARQD